MNLDRHGVSIYVEHHAATGPKRGTVLLSHGYSATSRMWSPQLSALREMVDVVIWDNRGHGLSDSPDDQALYSEDLAIADMAAILDHFEVSEAVIGGLSLGGYLSLSFTLAHPERTQALMAFDTGPGYRNDGARDGWNRNAHATADAIERKGFDGLNTSSAEVASAQHRDPMGLARAARGLLAQRDGHVMAGLASIDVPSLILVGSEDEPFLVATEVMAAKIPNAEKVVLDGAGHAANLDRPKAFNAAVVGFLDRVLPAG